MTVKEAFDSIVEDGIAKGAGDFVDPEALEVAAVVLAKKLRGFLVEVVHGRWENNKDDYPECDKCGYMPQYDPMIDDIWYSPYCPNCGAKMDGGKDE